MLITTFKNEYPEFGLEAEVYHHTELLFNGSKKEELSHQRM